MSGALQPGEPYRTPPGGHVQLPSMHDASAIVASGKQHACGTVGQLRQLKSETEPGGHCQSVPTQIGVTYWPEPQAVRHENETAPPQPPSTGNGVGAPASNEPAQPAATAT